MSEVEKSLFTYEGEISGAIYKEMLGKKVPLLYVPKNSKRTIVFIEMAE